MTRGKVLERWWGRALVYGVPFGVVMGLFDPDGRDSLLERLVTGVIAGVGFGLLMGWATQRQLVARRQRTAAFTAGLTEQGLRSAERASRKGPVPNDPAVNAAAAALARFQLEEITRHRNQVLVIFGVGTLAGAVFAVTGSPWWWLCVLVFAAMIALQLLQPRMLRKRLVLLDGQTRIV